MKRSIERIHSYYQNMHCSICIFRIGRSNLATTSPLGGEAREASYMLSPSRRAFNNGDDRLVSNSMRDAYFGTHSKPAEI
jgi:hypothetical protein